MLRKRGYSLVMWTTTFAVVLGAFVLVQVPFRRALQAKVRATTDYALWSMWPPPNNVPKRYSHDDNTRSRNKASQNLIEEHLESHDGTSKTYENTVTPSKERGVYSGIADGEEARLKIFDLNQFNLD